MIKMTQIALVALINAVMKTLKLMMTAMKVMIAKTVRETRAKARTRRVAKKRMIAHAMKTTVDVLPVLPANLAIQNVITTRKITATPVLRKIAVRMASLMARRIAPKIMRHRVVNDANVKHVVAHHPVPIAGVYNAVASRNFAMYANVTNVSVTKKMIVVTVVVRHVSVIRANANHK